MSTPSRPERPARIIGPVEAWCPPGSFAHHTSSLDGSCACKDGQCRDCGGVMHRNVYERLTETWCEACWLSTWDRHE
jgi:hypothetical protein